MATGVDIGAADESPLTVAEARRLVLEDAQNWPGFTRLVDRLIELVRAEERERCRVLVDD